MLFQSLNLPNEQNQPKKEQRLFFCLGKKTLIIFTAQPGSSFRAAHLGKCFKFNFKICDASENHDFTVLHPIPPCNDMWQGHLGLELVYADL